MVSLSIVMVSLSNNVMVSLSIVMVSLPIVMVSLSNNVMVSLSIVMVSLPNHGRKSQGTGFNCGNG
jgi:hypothetical protein